MKPTKNNLLWNLQRITYYETQPTNKQTLILVLSLNISSYRSLHLGGPLDCV